jgi:membrane protease YdiL (CAAX protease family)
MTPPPRRTYRHADANGDDEVTAMAAPHRAAVPVGSPDRVLPFVGLVAVGSVPFWIAGAADADPSLGLPVDLPVSALMVVCPLGAAVALTARDRGVAGVRRLLRRAVDVERIRPRWRYAPILWTLPAVAVCSYAVQRLLGRSLPDAGITLGAVAGFTALYLVSTACEQLGWTAYATDAMLTRHDALTSALVLGVVWALWHVLPYLQAGRSPAWIVWQCVFTVALRVVMTSAYLATDRSVAATILVQTTADVSWSLFPRFGSHYDPAITGTLLAAVAVAITLAWGRRTLAPRVRRG